VGCGCHCPTNRFCHVEVKHSGHNILFIEFPSRDGVGYGVSRRQLHFPVDLACPGVQQSAKEAGKGQDVVYLVGIVRRGGGVLEVVSQMITGEGTGC